MAVNNGVWPVYDNVFKVGTEGRGSSGDKLVAIAELTTFTVKIDGKTEEWSPLELGGWLRRMMTAKSISITFSGKACPSDPGNAYIGGLAWEMGSNCNTVFEWDFPNGDSLMIPCVINVTAYGGGESTNVAGLEFEVLSDGKPTYTPKTGA